MADSTEQQEQTAGAWSRASTGYSHIGPDFFSFFGKALVDFARVPAGATVLDIATGRGANLFPAARQVGPQGKVIGVDFAAGMVKETGAELKAAGISNASVRQMNAEQLDFADQTFDFVFCSFALFFFPHPDQALRGFQRVLRPGGKVVVSTWGAHDPRWDWMTDMHKLVAPPQPQAEQQSETPDFDTAESLSQALQMAGFQDIQTQALSHEFYFASPDEWWAMQWTHGARIFWEQIPPAGQAQGRAFAIQKLTEMQQPEGIPVLLQALFAAGQRV